MSGTSSMSLYEVLDLLAQNSDRIDTLWNMFIGVHLAVLGGLIVLPMRVHWFEKVLAICGYAAFAFINRNGVVDTYNYHFALLDEVNRLSPDAQETGRIVVDYLHRFDLRSKLWYLTYVHPAAAVVVVGAITFANRFVAPAK